MIRLVRNLLATWRTRRQRKTTAEHERIERHLLGLEARARAVETRYRLSRG